MPTNLGTLVISAIRPNNSADLYPTALSNEIKGGFHTYSSYSSLATIPALRRQPGMLVNIYDDIETGYNGLYTLDKDLTTWLLLSGTSKEVISCQIDNIDGYYKVVALLTSPYIYKISKISYATSIGTCNLSVYIGLNNVLDYSNIPVIAIINSSVTNSPDNYINIGDSISVVINNTSSDLGYVNFQIELTKITPKVAYPNISVCGNQYLYQNNFKNI